MKTFNADEGKVFVEDGNNVLGVALYTPDNYDATRLTQVTEEEAESLRKEQERQAEIERKTAEYKARLEAGLQPDEEEGAKG